MTFNHIEKQFNNPLMLADRAGDIYFDIRMAIAGFLNDARDIFINMFPRIEKVKHQN